MPLVPIKVFHVPKSNFDFDYYPYDIQVTNKTVNQLDANNSVDSPN